MTEELLDKIDRVINDLYAIKNMVSNKNVGLVGNEFEYFRKLLFSTEWPEAVNKLYICDLNTDFDLIQRAKGIVDFYIPENINIRFDGLKCLDIGCGDGHVAIEIAEQGASLSVGYDLQTSTKWADQPKTTFSTIFDQVAELGPYDFILLFDVLDHVLVDTPESLLIKVERVLKDDGRVVLRAHPYISRHATHLYKTFNQAFIHLLFDDIELAKFGVSNILQHQIKTDKPTETYRVLFDLCGFKITSQKMSSTPLETFFQSYPMVNRVMRNNPMFSKFPSDEMKIEFIDYVLAKK